MLQFFGASLSFEPPPPLPLDVSHGDVHRKEERRRRRLRYQVRAQDLDPEASEEEEGEFNYTTHTALGFHHLLSHTQDTKVIAQFLCLTPLRLSLILLLQLHLAHDNDDSFNPCCCCCIFSLFFQRRRAKTTRSRSTALHTHSRYTHPISRRLTPFSMIMTMPGPADGSNV